MSLLDKRLKNNKEGNTTPFQPPVGGPPPAGEHFMPQQAQQVPLHQVPPMQQHYSGNPSQQPMPQPMQPPVNHNQAPSLQPQQPSGTP